MDIIVSGRRTDVPDRFRSHVESKLSKLAQIDSRILSVDVEVSRESNPRLSETAERVEITARGKGPILRSEAGASDRYAALDLAISKLTERARRAADRRKTRHRAARRALVHVEADVWEPPPAALAVSGEHGEHGEHGEPEEFDDVSVTPVGEVSLGDSPVVIREKIHVAAPLSVEEAIDEMEMVGHPFFLFVDSVSGLPSVLYHRHGWTYGVIRLQTKAP